MRSRARRQCGGGAISGLDVTFNGQWRGGLAGGQFADKARDKTVKGNFS